LAGTRFFRETTSENDQAIKAFDAMLLHALESPPQTVEGKPNELSPPVLSLTSEAREMWIRFANFVETELSIDGAYYPIKGLANKLPEHAARIAGVLTLVDDLHSETITADTLANGIKLARHYASEALRLFTAGSTDPDLIMAQQLLEWLQKQDNQLVPHTEIYQYGPNAIRSAKPARRIARILAVHGWISMVKGGATIDDKHYKEVWRVHGNGKAN
jgi:hypothetical protein